MAAAKRHISLCGCMYNFILAASLFDCQYDNTLYLSSTKQSLIKAIVNVDRNPHLRLRLKPSSCIPFIIFSPFTTHSYFSNPLDFNAALLFRNLYRHLYKIVLNIILFYNILFGILLQFYFSSKRL